MSNHQPHAALRVRGASRRALLALSLGVAAIAATPTSAQAADPQSIQPAIDRAAAQLERVQLPDGGFGTRLAARDTATVGEALTEARPQSPALARVAASLAGTRIDDADSLARATLATAQPSSRYTSALLGQQAPDGGFGLTQDYQPDPLDTALAVRALTAAGERDAARRAVDRLLKFASAGVWGADGGDVALTSAALLALEDYVGRYGTTAAIDSSLAAAISWLGGRQGLDGGWTSGPLATRAAALAVSALAPSAGAVRRVSSGADALLAAQLPDGSWGDPFTTALALRALHGARAAIERDLTAQLGDLAVTARDVSADPQYVDSGRAVTIAATITNLGVGVASGVTAELYLDDPALDAAPVATAALPDVAPGARTSIERTFAVTKPRGRARVYVVLRAPVGQDRDLTNNGAFINLYVRTARNSYRRTRDWPRAGRDMQHSGTTPNRLHPAVDPDPIWRAPADGQQIVAEGKVYFGEKGRITARDAKTGALVWQRGGSYQDDRYRAPIYNRGFIYTAAEGQAGALNARTGEPGIGAGGWGGDRPLFSVEVIPVEGAHDPVFLDMANVEFINAGQLHSGDDGMCQVWPYKDPSGSPWNERVWTGISSFYPPGSNPGNGRLFFRHSCDGLPLAFSGDDSRAFFASGNWVSGFDPAHGDGPNGETMLPLFDTKVPGLVRAPKAPLVDSLNQVIVAGWEGSELRRDNYWSPKFAPTGRGQVTAVDPASGALYWSFTTDTRLDGSPVEYKGTIIVVDRSGRVYGLDQVTGKLKWSWQPSGYTPPAADQQGESGQTLALSGRYLYVPHPDGHLYTLDARNGAVISATPFSARPYDLAIDDTNNAIYVRTLDGSIGAYRTSELPDQCAPDPANVPAASGAIERVSLNPDGAQATTPAVADQRPAMSADGKVVAYARDYGPPSYATDVVVRDLGSGRTTVLPANEQVDGNVTRSNPQAPQLSADGRYLGFVARQRDPRSGDQYMLLVLDRRTGTVEPVVKKADGTPDYGVGLDSSVLARASYWWQNPGYSMSGDGTTFAFVSTTNNVAPGAPDTDTAPDVYVVNRVTGERRLASRKRTASTYNEGNGNPSVSDDGRYVAFTSDESLTGAPVAPDYRDGNPPYVHVYDVSTDTLTPVTNPETGNVVNSNAPRISGDGRHVVFTSMSPTLYPQALRAWDPWTSGRSVDAFTWDRATGRVDFASPNDSGEHATYASISRPAISADGQYVAFQSTGSFVKGVTFDQLSQVIAHDATAGTTRQISHNGWGVSGSGESLAPSVSADGTRVVFLSSAPDLVTGDTNDARDVFVYDRTRPDSDGPGDPIEPDLSNCPVGVDEPESYSDLSIQTDDIEPGALEQSQPGHVDVTVHNGGGAPSEATTVRLYDGSAEHGTLIGEQSFAELAAGGSRRLTFTWDPVGDRGTHTLTAVADPDRLVFEQHVADDEATRSVLVAAPQIDLTVDADQPAYGANAAVALTARLTNHSSAAHGGRLLISIRDDAGDPVNSVDDADVHLDANGNAVVHAGWNTLDTSPGRYSVSARLLNAVGDEVTTATSAFSIAPDVAAGLALEADQLTYAPSDTAKLSALVSNHSANSSLTGTHVALSLVDSSGATRETWDLPSGDVMQAKTVRVGAERALRDLPAGTYDLRGTLLDAGGARLAEARAQLAVTSSSATGDGVSGSLTATPVDPYRFSAVGLRYSLTNTGNADIADATVRVRVSDITSGQTLKTLDDRRTIARGAATTGALSTTADMAEDRDYQASLYLVLADGSERPLDRAIVHVRPTPFTFGASFDTTSRNRVLVWACDRGDEAAARTALADTFATYVPDRSDPRYATEAGCGRYAGEEQARFMRLVRGGNYNQLWILGQHHPLERAVNDELAARVIQGDGLLIAGDHPGFDLNQGGNLSPVGAAFNGTVPSSVASALQFASGSAFAGLDATLKSAPAKVTTTTATSLATTSWGTGNAAKTAITATYNQFGQGKAIFLGAAPSAFADGARAAGVLGRAAQVLLPATTAPRAAGLARLELFVEGVAPGSPLEMRTQLPAGMTAQQPAADVTVAGSLLTVPFDAAGTQRRQRGVWLKLPDAASATTTSTVRYRDAADGQTKAFGTPVTATIGIAENRQTARDAALAALGRVSVSVPGDQKKLQKIKDDVTAAGLSTTDTGVLWTRLRALVDDIGALETTRWTGSDPARTAVARVVANAEYDYDRAGGQ